MQTYSRQPLQDMLQIQVPNTAQGPTERTNQHQTKNQLNAPSRLSPAFTHARTQARTNGRTDGCMQARTQVGRQVAGRQARTYAQTNATKLHTRANAHMASALTRKHTDPNAQMNKRPSVRLPNAGMGHSWPVSAAGIALICPQGPIAIVHVGGYHPNYGPRLGHSKY